MTFAILAFVSGIAIARARDPIAPVGLLRDVVFTRYPPFADNGERLRRLVSPLDALQIEQRMGGNRDALRAEPLDPAQQRFTLYVPRDPAPATGYALLVFIPPSDDARVPVQWIPALDRTHTIFVCAAHSGNDADVLDRREPLALLAAYGVMYHYHINPAQVYIGGFSGGSRVALRLALGYPDLFRGALLDAGSDPIGTAQVPLPPPDLLHVFQQSSRIVFVTGDEDVIRQAQLARADASLEYWCAFDKDSLTAMHTRHALADAFVFAQALRELQRRKVPEAARMETCREAHQGTLKTRLEQVESLAHSGQTTQAIRLLTRIDARYGGLAAPRSVELSRVINARNARQH